MVGCPSHTHILGRNIALHMLCPQDTCRSLTAPQTELYMLGHFLWSGDFAFSGDFEAQLTTKK